MTDVYDFDSYKEFTGKRFKLTKDQKEEGLTREEALEEWIADFEKLSKGTKDKEETLHVQPLSSDKKNDSKPKDKPEKKEKKPKKIVITIVPEVGVDLSDLKIPFGEHTIRQNIGFYNWLHELQTGSYRAQDADLILKHILDQGVFAVNEIFPFEEDVDNFLKYGKTFGEMDSPSEDGEK